MADNYGATLSVRIKRTLPFISILVVIFCIYLIVSAIITAETTGILNVTVAQKANISLSQINRQAKIIGTQGKAGVRLRPGVYQLVATTSSGQVAARTVSVEKKQSTTVNLTPVNSPKLPSVHSISFFGTSSLTDLGISSTQLDALKLDFFHFKTSAGAVTIDAQTAQTASHNLGDPFVITFAVSIDSQTFNAKITYTDTQNIQLQLYSPKNGQLLYDSSPSTNIQEIE